MTIIVPIREKPIPGRVSYTLPWEAFLPFFRWRQGEHLTLIGPTGAGKTTLARAILPMRKYVVVAATKPKDESLALFRQAGYKRISSWPPSPQFPKVILWPRIEGMENIPAQKQAFEHMLKLVYRSGAWTVYIDELSYFVDVLGLEPRLRVLWLQGRSLGASLVTATQRPRHVPLVAYSQVAHLFIWQTNDDQDLKRLSEIGGKVNTKQVQYTVSNLEGHDVLYVNTRTGRALVTKAPM